MLSDPILLGEKLDGILFLVGLGKGSRMLAPQATRRIKATGVDLLGIICNQVNFPSRLNDYGYEYGYYYHYAYAYKDSYVNKNPESGSYITSKRTKNEQDRYISESSMPTDPGQSNPTLNKITEKNSWIQRILRRGK
jgi:Mrp family chromosome partitioning ATPase